MCVEAGGLWFYRVVMRMCEKWEASGKTEESEVVDKEWLEMLESRVFK